MLHYPKPNRAAIGGVDNLFLQKQEALTA